MAEPRDDPVSAAFRALPPLEPPPALDDAIRAAARRAVAAKPVSSTRRWALPASIAAVLALSIGVALHVEREKPLVVDGTPVPSGSAEYPVTPAPAEEPAMAPAPKADASAKDSAAAIRSPEPKALREEARIASPGLSPQRMAPPNPAANEVAPQAAPAPAPAPAAAVPFAAPVPSLPAAPAIPSPPAATPPAPATADAARGAPSSATSAATLSVAPMRAKREAAGASVAKEAVASTPDKRLERIAELRAAGRHAEADEALAIFRRDYPDFVFTPEVWDKVRAR